MTRRDHADDCATTPPAVVDPWAPGGAMASVPPTSSSKAHLAFGVDADHTGDRDRRDGDRDRDATARLGPDGMVDRDADGVVDADTRGAPHRPAPRQGQRWLAAGGLLLALGVGIALAVSVDNSDSAATTAASTPLLDPPSTAPAATLPAPTAPRSTPPPLLADVTAATLAAIGPTNVAPSDAAQTNATPSDAVPSDAPGQRSVIPAPREFIVEIAPELAEINSTEVIALDADGALWAVSLPSGRVRVTELGFAAGSEQRLAVNDGGAVVWPTPDGGAQVIGADASVTQVRGQIGAVSWSPGSSAVYLWGGQTANSTPSGVALADLRSDSLTWRRTDWIDLAEGAEPVIGLDGALLRADTGGTYRIGATSTELFTTGDVVATGANHVLVRECDVRRVCALVSIDGSGERLEWNVDLPTDIVPQRTGGVSPGGDALLFNGQRVAPDVARDVGVFELTDADRRSLRTPNQESAATWDTTGAGVFIADGELVYIDRFTTNPLIVAAGLPPLRAAAARRPAATPACEVLAIARSQFAPTAPGDGTNTASPPVGDVLDRLIELLPTELAVAVTPLLAIVNEPLADPIAESTTVGNGATATDWPADALAAIDALDGYAAAECPFIDV